MRLHIPRDDDVEINLTSLIDVVLLLIVFFMLSTTFVQQSAIKLSLPQASAGAVTVEDAHVLVEIDAEGRYYVDRQSLVNGQIETIKRALGAAISGRDPAPPIVIRADERTPHQAVIDVLDAARQLGLLQITFSTRARDGSAS